MKRFFEIGLLLAAMLVVAVKAFPEEIVNTSQESNITNIRTFTVTPSRIRKGELATLRWHVTGNPRVVNIIRDRQLPALGSFERIGQLTVRPEKTTDYVLFIREGDEVFEKTVTVEVDESPVLWRAQACKEIKTRDAFQCIEPYVRDNEGDGRCFSIDPGDGNKADFWETVKILLRFRDLPRGEHNLSAIVWNGNRYPADNRATRFDKGFILKNHSEDWAHWFQINPDRRIKYWRVRIFLDGKFMDDVEFRVC